MLEIAVTNYMGEGYSIELQETGRGRVTYWESPYSERKVRGFVLSQARADVLINFLERKLRGSKAEFVNPNVLDGFRWSITLKKVRETLAARGINEYPPWWGEVLKTIEEIMGSPGF